MTNKNRKIALFETVSGSADRLRRYAGALQVLCAFRAVELDSSDENIPGQIPIGVGHPEVKGSLCDYKG